MIARFAYPMMLDLTGITILIVGAGAVAVRKVRGLLDAGAQDIRVAAIRFDPRMPESPAVRWIAEPYRPDHLDGVRLAFAATDRPDVNDAVVGDARQRGIWANRADADAEPEGDFSTPAVLRRGQVTITVSAGSAALAAAIRDGLNENFDPRWQAMADAMLELRPLLRDSGLPLAARAELFRELSREQALQRLNDEGPEPLRRWVIDRIHPQP